MADGERDIELEIERDAREFEESMTRYWVRKSVGLAIEDWEVVSGRGVEYVADTEAEAEEYAAKLESRDARMTGV